MSIPISPDRVSTPPWAAGDPLSDGEAYRAEWQDYTSDEYPSGSGAVATDGRGRVEDYDDLEESFVLYCGGEDPRPPRKDYSKPFRPSALPILPSESSSRGIGSGASASRSTGCGAVIHLRAYPQRQGAVWVGKEEATDSVVGLGESYFERNVVAKMMKNACGCVREGVGCSECGNPLGTRYMPCQAATDGIFSSGSSSSQTRPAHPPRPSGPEYWAPFRSQSYHRSSDTPRGAFYVYTFFASHVSSQPQCHFPPADKTQHRRSEVTIAPPTPTRPDNGNWYGYTQSASPRPYSPAFAPNPTAVPSQAETPGGFLSRRPSRRGRIADDPDEQAARGIEPALTRLEFDTSSRGREDANFVREGDASHDTDVELDADGVLVEPDVFMDPNSPDKNEFMAWPGR